jgi:hypothetical protein
MRLLLLLSAMGILAAAEPIPVLDLDYEADGPRLPAPLAAWWNRALADAAAWTASRGGVPVAAGSVAGITSLRLSAAALPTAGGLEPWAAGWVDGLDAAGEGALAALVARWPGYTLNRAGDGRVMVEAAGIVPPHRVTMPGWRVSLHGPGLSALLQPLMPGELSAATWERVRALLADWEPDSTTALAGACIDTGLPARWFTVPDARIASRLPRMAVARAVVALDGAALGADLDRLFPADDLPPSLAGIAGLPGGDLRGLASALTGTWAGWWDGADGGLLCVPRSLVGDGLLRLLAARERFTLPTDATVVRMQPDGAFGACDGDCWIFATDGGFITDWQAAPAAGWAPAIGEAVIDGDVLATLLAQLPLALVAQLPLSDNLHGGGATTRDGLARDLGLPAPPTPGWPNACLALAGSERSRVGFAAHEGQLRLELDGPVLPWVVPGLALRAFADHGQNLVGSDLLRRTIDRLRAEGAGAWPEDLLAGVPVIDLPRLEAAERTMAEVERSVKAVKQGALWKRVRAEGIPLPDAAAAPELPALLAVVEASADMDAADFPLASTMTLRRAEIAGTLGPAMRTVQGGSSRALVQAARELAALGRPEAVLLLRRARRLSAQPVTLLDSLLLLASLPIDDDAMLALAVGGATATTDLTAWLAEPPPSSDRLLAAWRGERVMSLGWLAKRWLAPSGTADGPDMPSTEMLGGSLRPRFLALHGDRAEVPEDLALMMDAMHGLEAGQSFAEAMARLPRSALVCSVLPAFRMIASQPEDKAMRHQLVRLAWRLQSSGALPADAAAAAALVGPLQVPCGGAQVPLLYRRLPAGGFALLLDPEAPMPAGLRADRWKRWIQPAREGQVDRFAVMPEGRMAVIIDPAAALPPPPPAAAEGAGEPRGANGF